MLKYFNFSLFLITLGIASVAPAHNKYIEDEDRMPAPNAFSPFGFDSPSFNSGFRPLRPMGLGRPLSKSSSFGGDDIDNLLNNMHSSLSKLKDSLANLPNSNMEKSLECCTGPGKCRAIEEGELCNGVVKSSFQMKLGPLALPSSDKNSKSPKPADNKSKSPVTPDADDSEPPFKSDADLQKWLGDLSGMNKNGMQSEEDHIGLQGPPQGGKRIPGAPGMYYVMPDEKEIEKHSYEKPLGLTDAEVKDYRNEVLRQTNMYRKNHGLDPVTLNEDMNNHAQEWANILAPEQRLRHRTEDDNKIYGENLYYISDEIEHLGEVAVNAWYNELRFIHPDDDEDQYQNPRGVIGHLTQLLWKKSKVMGVGVAKNKYGGYVVVANYNPGGNVIPFYKENLPEFSQASIDAAQKAHELHEKKLKTPRMITFGPKSPLGRSLSSGSPSFSGTPFGNLENFFSRGSFF